MKVIGTATVRFCVEIDAEDISTNSMSIEESDKLVAEAVFLKHGLHVDFNQDITVEKVLRGNEN
ncbi:hypothetical protein [Bacillus wiedmannii]|uniref:hypothetical protein n=1 Tax=Bacillus wiedmannii TaxID=1890302 RepID=UPI003D1CAE10